MKEKLQLLITGTAIALAGVVMLLVWHGELGESMGWVFVACGGGNALVGLALLTPEIRRGLRRGMGRLGRRSS